MAKQKAKQKAEIPREVRVCGLSGCDNTLISAGGGTTKKKFCCIKCQQKHNNSEATKRNKIKRDNAPKVYRICKGCGAKFEYSSARGRQEYCVKGCQLNNKTNDKKNAEYARRTAEIKAEGKRKGIDKKWLTRGNISTSNRDSAISCEA